MLINAGLVFPKKNIEFFFSWKMFIHKKNTKLCVFLYCLISACILHSTDCSVYFYILVTVLQAGGYSIGTVWVRSVWDSLDQVTPSRDTHLQRKQ